MYELLITLLRKQLFEHLLQQIVNVESLALQVQTHHKPGEAQNVIEMIITFQVNLLL